MIYSGILDQTRWGTIILFSFVSGFFVLAFFLLFIISIFQFHRGRFEFGPQHTKDVKLAIIFLILYLQFHSVSTTMLVFSGIGVAWSGGFILIWLYNQPWFLDFTILGLNMRELFNVEQINLSVAVWVGFLALFGIATDDGVVMATYLRDMFKEKNPRSIREIRKAAVECLADQRCPARRSRPF